MTAVPIRLLLLEDNPGDARLVQVALAEHAPGEFTITMAVRLADALARIGTEAYDAMLCDLGLPDSKGLASAQAIAARAPSLPLVVLTGSHDQRLGREAIQHGAQDYLVKGEANGALIARTLRYAIERKRLEIGLRQANEALERRVTERTAELESANDTLRASETRYRALFDNMLDGFAYCKMEYDDRDRPVDFVYLAVNAAFERLTGLKDVVGRPVSEVIPGIRETSPELFEIYGRVASSGNPETFEYFFKPLAKWLSIAVYGLQKGYFAAIFDDITERKLAAEALRELNASLEQRVELRTADLTAANTALEAFSYSVSHDLRAPLRSIDGFSLVLLEDYSDKLNEDGKDWLRRVRAAAQRMGDLIDDLLKLSHVTRSDINVETVDLSALARSVAHELEDSEPDRRVAFEIPPDLIVRGDKRLLLLLLEHLLGNAWKYTGKRASARIGLGVNEIAGDPAYFVCDNGAGFDMAHIAKLFAPFQRLHSVSEFPGTGIGLATVARIVQRHGGRIWAEGAVDRGAAFYFTLPG